MRAFTSVRRWWSGLQGRSRSVASIGFVSVAVAGLLVAIFLADGFRATSYDLQDASVWVTRDGSGVNVGRINTQIAAQDAAFKSDVSDPDLVQDGRAVFVLDRSGRRLVPVDPAMQTTLPDAVPLPEGAQVALADGTLAVVDPGGDVWVGSADDATSIGAGEAPANLRLGAGGVVDVGRHGDVVAFAPPADQQPAQLITLPKGASEADRVELELDGAVGEGRVQVSMVGSTPVALDATDGALFIGGGDPVDLTGFGADPKVQLPGDDSSQVLVATEEGLVSIPTDGGRPDFVRQAAIPDPVRPARIAGCSYGAWGGVPTGVVACDGFDQIEAPLEGAAPPLKFRVNRNNVVLNDLKGSVWWNTDGELTKVSDWDGARSPDPTPDTDEPEPEDDQPRVLSFDQENTPPQAKDDTDVGVRAGQDSLVTVLDNDVDLDGDVLTIASATAPSDVEVSIVNNGQALQVRVPDAATAAFDIAYSVTDGRSSPDCDSCSATASVSITPKDKNSAPVPKGTTPSLLKVEAGKSATYDVLSDWKDPDGDPIYLEGATVDGEDAVQTVPTGLLTFTAYDARTGTKSVAVSVRDTPPAPAISEVATGDLTVQVDPSGTGSAPVTRPDYLSTVVGATVIIAPLANDTDANGDSLTLVGKLLNVASGRVLNSDGVDGASAVPNPEDGTISFSATETGSYVFGYEATDGLDTVPGLIRVDVAAAGDNRPSAGRDLVVIPNRVDAVRTVDLLANDVDLDGDVLSVRSVDAPSDGSLKLQVLEGRRLRVISMGLTPNPITLTYVVSDGRYDDEGQVVIAPQPGGTSDVAPIAVTDKVSVRAGDLVTIPVLANDLSPGGGELELLPELSSSPTADQGLAWIAGRTVRFLAGETPGTVTMTYQVGISDGVGVSPQTGFIEVAVRPATDQNRPPVPRTVEARVVAGGSVRVVIPLAGIDPDGDSVSLAGIGLGSPKLGRLVTPVGTDTIVYEAYSAGADAGGTDEFSYTVEDRRGERAEGVVRVGVVAPWPTNRRPVAAPDLVRVKPGATVAVGVLANDYDPDGDEISLDGDATEPGGLDVTTEETRLLVTAPGQVGEYLVGYRVSDGVAWGDGDLKLVVADDAVGKRPIARDDQVRELPADSDEVAVDVLDNDEDPDGDTAALDVTTPNGGAGVAVNAKKQVVIQLTDRAQVVPYSIADGDGTATAVVRVPPRSGENLPPRPKALDKPIEAKVGEVKSIKIADYVEDPEGAPVQLTFDDRVSASNGDYVVIDAGTLEFTPRPGARAGSITFEVTDDKDRNLGATAVISLPITILSDVNTPPEWLQAPSADLVPAGEVRPIDLRSLVDDVDPDDELTFTAGGLSGLPAGVDATIDGSDNLLLSASSEAVVGDRGTMTLSVSDGGTRPIETQVAVTIIDSDRRPPSCPSGVPLAAEKGDPVTPDVLADCYDPFEGEDESPLTLVSVVAADPSSGSVTYSDTSLEFTPEKVGTAVVTYTVEDALRRRAGGSFTVEVRDVPGKPTPPREVSTASRTVTLEWQAAERNGSDIEHYELAWDGGSKICDGPSTTCTVDGLRNGTSYSFRVRAHNASGDGPWSEQSDRSTPDQLPGAPASVTLEFDPARGSGTLVASWTAAPNDGSPLIAYDLRISPEPPAGVVATRSVGTRTTEVWEGLENGTPYQVTVVARNAAGSGPSTVSNFEFPAEPPDPAKAWPKPTAIRVATAIDGGQVNVSWSRPADGGDPALSYRVRVLKADGSVFTTLPTAGSSPLTALALPVAGLDPKGTFRFQVLVTNKAGTSESPLSDAVQPGGLPRQISSVTGTPVNTSTTEGGQVALSFTAPESQDAGGITGYQVKVNGGSPQSKGTTLPLVITGLSNTTTSGYVFEVAACNRFGCAVAYSRPTAAIFPYGKPFPPTISVVGTSQSSVTFRVTAPSRNGQDIVRLEVSNGASLAGTGDVTIPTGCGANVAISAVAVDRTGARSDPGAGSGTSSACPPPPPPPRTVSASWGSARSVTGCTSNCFNMVGTVSGFAPNSSFQVRCEYRTSSGAAWNGNFGYIPPNIVTDGNGNGSTGNTGASCVGSPSGSWEYRFVIDGVGSNPLG